MAPHPRSIVTSRIETWTLWTVAEIFSKILLFISILAVAVKLYTLLSLRRRNMLVQQSLCHDKMSIASLVVREKRPSSSPPEDQNQRLQALKKELAHPEYIPVHPWIGPPTPLPGPYDAPYYPLPSISRYSEDPSTKASPSGPEELQSVSYTRRVSTNSTNSTSSQDSVLHGTTTVSNHGWRRTQWTVSKG
jgi:hypothetical protein